MITARINDDSEVILENIGPKCRLRVRSKDKFADINTRGVNAEQVLQTVRRTQEALRMIEDVVSNWIEPKEGP